MIDDTTGGRSSPSERHVQKQSITVVGAGIFGLWQALVLARAGHRVRLIDASSEPFTAGASRWAGAMLAPDCEAEAAPPEVRTWGRDGLNIWRATYPHLINNGTLVVAAARDQPELVRYARMTHGGVPVDTAKIAELEPDLGARFSAAIYFADEAHMAAAAALRWLLQAVRDMGVDVRFATTTYGSGSLCIDCRGLSARADLPALRGVRGERVIVTTKDMRLARPIRLLHPRQPIYVVPQGDDRFVIGATVIEREDAAPMTVKSALDLLGSAYALHPAFAEASIIDMGAGVRPAFPDNVPHIVIDDAGKTLRVNGAYRHGFLLAPVMAHAVADFIDSGVRHPAFT